MTTELKSLMADLESNICQVVLGKPYVVRMSLVALLAEEHMLLEDVPGVGKTLVAKALAKSVDADFCRIQFTLLSRGEQPPRGWFRHRVQRLAWKSQ